MVAGCITDFNQTALHDFNQTALRDFNQTALRDFNQTASIGFNQTALEKTTDLPQVRHIVPILSRFNGLNEEGAVVAVIVW
jgi:hypothetical protein